MPADYDDLLTLRRQSRIKGWFQLGWRIAAAVALIGILILFHWLEREGLKDTHDGDVSLLDVIYFTMISATTTGYGDIVPVTERTRLFDALVVTPIRILFLLFFIGTAYHVRCPAYVGKVCHETHSAQLMSARRRGRLWHQEQPCGPGADRPRRRAETIVVDAIRRSARHCAKAAAAPCSRRTRPRCHASSRACRQGKLVIISAGRDDTSILICLTTRHLAPDVRISLAVNQQDNEVPRAGQAPM